LTVQYERIVHDARVIINTGIYYMYIIYMTHTIVPCNRF